MIGKNNGLFVIFYNFKRGIVIKMACIERIFQKILDEHITGLSEHQLYPVKNYELVIIFDKVTFSDYYLLSIRIYSFSLPVYTQIQKF